MGSWDDPNFHNLGLFQSNRAQLAMKLRIETALYPIKQTSAIQPLKQIVNKPTKSTENCTVLVMMFYKCSVDTVNSKMKQLKALQHHEKV